MSLPIWYEFLLCTVLVSLRLGEVPRTRVNRWVDEDRATCFDHAHQCPVGFHQTILCRRASLDCPGAHTLQLIVLTDQSLNHHASDAR